MLGGAAIATGREPPVTQRRRFGDSREDGLGDVSNVRDVPAKSRFEMSVEGHTALVAYRMEGGWRVLDHTEVPDALAGRGVGGRLARGVFDLLRAAGEQVKVTCPFLVKWLEKNPDYRDLSA
jgi:predicted GNAT family acetyltransferase